MNLGSVFHRYRPLINLSDVGAGAVVSSTDATSYVGSTGIWGADELGLVTVMATGTTDTGTVTSSIGKTYTKIAGITFNGGVDSLYVFICTSLYGGLAFGNTYSDNVTFHCTDDQATGCVMQLWRIQNIAKTGTAAVLQTASDSNSSGTPTTTFSSAVNTNNATISIIGNGANSTGVTIPTGWTNFRDQGYTVPTAGAHFVGRNSGFSGTTITWGSSSATPYGALSIELDQS